MKTKQFITAAFETIDFQNGNFGKELEILFSILKENYNSIETARKSKTIKNIEECIRSNTGLNISIILNNSNLIAMNSISFKHGHIFFSKYEQELIKEVNKKTTHDKLAKFSSWFEVDLKKSKISGFFSNVKNQLFIEYDKFFSNKSIFTIRELVGIVLHEIGHAFTVFEYCSRVVTNNQALVTVTNSVLNKNDQKIHRQNLETVETFLNIKKGSLSDLFEITDDKVITTVLLDKIINNKRSELGTDFYDYTSSEYLADQFAARHGYGIDMITGLEKLKSNKDSLINYIKDLVGLILEIFTLFIIHVSGPISTVMFYSFLLYYGKLYKEEGKLYDDPKIRYKRIKEQLIQNLKKEHLNKTEVETIILNIEKADKIIDSTLPNVSILKTLIEYVYIDKKEKNSMKLQRKLEELASNDLFVKAAKLKTMTI
jgi:hypothetical protein